MEWLFGIISAFFIGTGIYFLIYFLIGLIFGLLVAFMIIRDIYKNVYILKVSNFEGELKKNNPIILMILFSTLLWPVVLILITSAYVRDFDYNLNFIEKIMEGYHKKHHPEEYL